MSKQDKFNGILENFGKYSTEYGKNPHMFIDSVYCIQSARLCLQSDHKRISYLSKLLVDKLSAAIPKLVRNGDAIQTYPGCVNLSFSCVEGESLLMGLKDIAVSSGSACTSASLEPSYVLRAIGAEEDLAHSSIRFGIGRFTTEEEVIYTVEKTVKMVQHLRGLSPLWEMVEGEGVMLGLLGLSQLSNFCEVAPTGIF